MNQQEQEKIIRQMYELCVEYKIPIRGPLSDMMERVIKAGLEKGDINNEMAEEMLAKLDQAFPTKRKVKK